MSKKVVMIIAKNDFRDEELLEPKAVLEAKGISVTVASSSLGEAVGALGALAKIDMTIDNVNPSDFDAVIFIGGSGASEYWDSPVAHNIAKSAAEGKKIVAAICIAPVTLANAGLLSGKRATVWASEAETLKQAGAVYTGKEVEIDGNIVTANSPGAAKKFGEAIAEKLK